MSIKLIVTDLDGTFLNSNHLTIPQENIDAFKRAQASGIKLALASGRTKILADYVLEQVPFVDYLITSNGAITYDLKAEKEISSTLMTSSQSVEIFNILDEYTLPYEIYFDGDCYMNSKSYTLFDEDHVAPHIYNLLKNFIKEVPDLEALIQDKGIEKLNILSLTGEERMEIEERVIKTGNVAFASSFPLIKGAKGNLEMTHQNATKGFAINALANALNISNENIMCFGDSENDCSMLELAHYSFAMGNGTDLVKSTAKIITDTNDNGGVAKAINKYVFGE